MRNTIACLLSAATLLAISTYPALAEKASCQQLDEMIEDLDLLSDDLENQNYDPDPILERGLRALILDARDLAADENDNASVRAVNGMIDGWNNGDADLYIRNADRLAGRLDYFFNRDC